MIAEQIRGKGAVRISELVEQFGVSVETIRRDLLELEKGGQLRRVHGGAVGPVQSGQYSTLPERREENASGKSELARYATELLDEGDSVFIDCGSTAAVFAEQLARQFARLTVITNSLDVFERLRDREGFELYLCSGVYLRGENAFCGSWAVERVRCFHAGTAFICPSGISLEYGVMDYDRELYHVQRAMMECADRTVFLADSGKFEKSALLKLADVKPGCTLVTDAGLSDEIRDLYRENGIRIAEGRK
ncbi:MAG: DeoR/GlpR family DNA-binding transcription regulator [Eubacteriales bacterium]|nr:DeoR/GlpR family DNA-binding transcription regulator [Eubacteriales bacterium]